MFKNIDKALEWIMASKKGEMSFDVFKNIIEKIGNPQDNFNLIHVAGTNGKGSTITFLRDLLMSQGFKVGTLQSPHYLTHLDRIRLNGENIKDEDFLEIINENLEFFKKEKLGMFEMDYLIMLEYFKREMVDYLIVETGIGGRLDSTNVCNNTKLSIITNIGFDHTEMLGETLEKICMEKCGIIKNNSHVLVGYLEEDLKRIVREKALEKNSKYHIVKEYEDLGNREFVYDKNTYSLLSYGKYQIKNASLALEALNLLGELDGFDIDYSKIKTTLSNSLWKGRFEIVSQNPRIILDGAHNTHGIIALMESFDELDGSKCIIFSALKRKDYSSMCTILKNHCDKLVITKFNYYGAISLDDIEEEYKEEDWLIAIEKAQNEFDNVLVCGSLYFISEVASELERMNKSGK